MANETTPPSEAEPAGEGTEGVPSVPEAGNPMDESTGESSGESSEDLPPAPEPGETPESELEEEGALIPEDGEGGEGAEPQTEESASGEQKEGEAEEGEDEEEDSGGPISKTGFVVVSTLTFLLMFGGLTWYYMNVFAPNLKELAKLSKITAHAKEGNATAQYKLAEQLYGSYVTNKAEGKSVDGLLMQSYKWYSLAARTYLEEDSHAEGHGDDHGLDKPEEKKHEISGAKMFEKGKAYHEEFKKAHTKKDQHEKLELAFKWLSLAHDEKEQNAHEELDKVREEIEKMGPGYFPMASSVVLATKKLKKLEASLAPDQLESAQHMVSSHALKAEQHGHEAHWSYEGITGPTHWGDMKKDFAQASHGTRQSPINIDTKNVLEAAFLNPVHFRYNSQSTFEVVNNGHTIKVNVSPPKSGDTKDNSIKIGENHYKLLQFHFHSKSEHKIDGKHTAMELHLVHVLEHHDDHDEKSGDHHPKANDAHGGGHGSIKQPDLAVIGVMIRDHNKTDAKVRPALGDHSVFMGQIWETLDTLQKETPKGTRGMLQFNMDPARLLPEEGHRSYFQYRGSLTTPPCTENVLWTVLEEPIYLTTEQINKFKKLPFFDKIGRINNRPVQELNDRYVLKFNEKKHKPHWSYEGKVGTKNWGKYWPVAGNGKRQSPIDISTADALDAEGLPVQLKYPIHPHYSESNVTIENNGHTIQANFPKDNNTLLIASERYKLLQFHFHHKSEHTINGNHTAMELHLVHVQEANPAKLAVIGVMIEEGEEDNQALVAAKFWEGLPEPAGNGHKGHKNGGKKSQVFSFDPSTFIPKEGGYFQYQGSLTTPPATENVLWTVMQKPIKFSKKQIDAFREFFPSRNNREVQKPFDRLIQRYKGLGN